MELLRLFVFVPALVLVYACATPEGRTTDPTWAEGAVCASDELRVMADFAAARANECAIRGDRLILTILPEATPVNPSPWYAFQLESKAPKLVRVELRYPEFRHRYPPKVSNDRVAWETIPEELVDIRSKGERARFPIEVGTEPLFISAQEIFPYAEHVQWAQQLAQMHDGLDLTTVGESSAGVNIVKLQSAPRDASGAVFLVGRQHPPEISGAIAFKAFAEELYTDTALATRFREHFAVVAIPALNPDGVDAGNWRLGPGGLDLNRDWGPFTQPETQLMRDELEQANTDFGLALFLDFHSTFKNVIYTQTDDVETRPAKFAERWHSAMSNADPTFGLVREGGHNTGRPTSKGYVYDTYGVAAITYEMEDEEDRDAIIRFAKVAARSMMEILLNDLKDDAARQDDRG